MKELCRQSDCGTILYYLEARYEVDVIIENIISESYCTVLSRLRDLGTLGRFTTIYKKGDNFINFCLLSCAKRDLL